MIYKNSRYSLKTSDSNIKQSSLKNSKSSHRLQIMYLPTGCPELSAIEECWHQLKIQPFMYEHHEHVSGSARAAMKYLRTAAFSQNIEQYLFRRSIAKTF